MGCGCGQKSHVEYQVTFKDKAKPQETYATSQEAVNAIRAAGGGHMRPVPKKR